jgi:hypothetical protein
MLLEQLFKMSHIPLKISVWKMRSVETIPGMGGKGDKVEWWRRWIKIWYIVRAFVNATMYPSTTIKNRKKQKKKRNYLYVKVLMKQTNLMKVRNKIKM